MKITDLEPVVVHVNHRGNWVFVLVHTDSGLTGLGEASTSGDDRLVLATLKRFRERLVGQDPRQIQTIWNMLHRLGAGQIAQTTLSAIEQALWDILGQHLEVPIYTLLGGKIRDRFRLYANINRHVTDRTSEGFATAARQAVDEGFTAIKMAPFDELNKKDHIRTGPRATWQAGVERVKAVREAIGNEIELAVDCHSRMEVSEALIVAEALADCNLLWYEEPVPDNQPDGLAEITAAAPMPTASGERLYGLESFAPFLTRRVVDVIMPDVKHDGGLMETKRIGDACRLNHILVAPHNPTGPVATAASAQVMATVTNFMILEFAWGEVDWRAKLLDPPERIESGDLLLPAEPGLGHRLNQAVVAAHAVSLD